MTTPVRSRALHRWVPAEHRWFGIDRRTILPAAIVLASAAVMHWGVPWLDEQVPYTAETTAGDTFTLTGDVIVTPPAGWSIASGVVTGDGSPSSQVVISSGGTTVQLHTARWSGNVRSLFDQIRTTETMTRQQIGLHFTGTSRSFTTTSGAPGLLSSFTSTSTTGAIGAVLVGGTGVEVIVAGPTSGTALDGDVGRLLASITSTAPANGAGS